MRVCISKYSHSSKYQVCPEKVGRGTSYKNSLIKWDLILPELTAEQETSIRADITDQFGTRGYDEAQKIIQQVLGYRKNRQTLEFNFYVKQLERQDERDRRILVLDNIKFPEKCSLQSVQLRVYKPPDFPFSDWYEDSSDSYNEKGTYPGIEVLLQLGKSFIFFNDMKNYCVGICAQGSKTTSFPELSKRLFDVPHDQFKVTVFAVFRNVHPMVNVGPYLAPRDLAESNWKIFLDQYQTDVTILAMGGLVDCHRAHLASNSRVLHEKLFQHPSCCEVEAFPINKYRKNKDNIFIQRLKPVVIDLQDLSCDQVEAFLRYQYSRKIDKILESPVTSLKVLKVAERYEICGLWDDTIAGLLQKNSDWFDLVDWSLELEDFLENCERREDEATHKLSMKLFELLDEHKHTMDTVETKEGISEVVHNVIKIEVPVKIEQTGAYELNQPNNDSMNWESTHDDGSNKHDVTSAAESETRNVDTDPGSSFGNQNARRSTRIATQISERNKRKPVRREIDHQFWHKALKGDAEGAFSREKSVPQSRAIYRDPTLPKVAITPDRQIKVEKVEPPEEGQEDSNAMDAEEARL